MIRLNNHDNKMRASRVARKQFIDSGCYANREKCESQVTKSGKFNVRNLVNLLTSVYFVFINVECKMTFKSKVIA